MKKIFKNLNKWKFAVKQETKGYNVTFTPVCKQGIFSQWQRIVHVEDGRYYLLDLPNDSTLTQIQCLEHIEFFKEQLRRDAIEAKVEILYHSNEELKKYLKKDLTTNDLDSVFKPKFEKWWSQEDVDKKIFNKDFTDDYKKS